MPLFPAYASLETQEIESDEEEGAVSSGDDAASPAREAKLLASDEEVPPRLPERTQLTDHTDFYVDTRFDGANLPVTTLYYPGRPQYEYMSKRRMVGGKRTKDGKVLSGKWKRYYDTHLHSEGDVMEEASARAQALRRDLALDPNNHQLWLRYIEFQEQWAGGEAALRAADEADEAGAGAPLRAPLLKIRARHLLRREYCALLQRHLSHEKEPGARLELWVRLVRAAGATEAGGAAAVCARALAQLRSVPLAYPHLLFAFGCWARDAGLWELLVLLVELVGGVCFPSGAHLTPPPDDELHARLVAHEDKIIGSGLPMHTVWARVERARAHAHWHAPRELRAPDSLDPQRVPHPADVADLLLPVADPDAALLLCSQLLRLAKVPLLPAAEAASPAPHWPDDEPYGGEALLPLLVAARRLPAAHPARCGGASIARRLVARFVDPPHYFSDDNGYLRWVSGLWEACCEWTTGERRTALLCWRMRWWHALLLLVDKGDVEGAREAQRIAVEARGALKRFADSSPVPFGLFARVLRATEAAAGGSSVRATAVATRALRAALADPDCPTSHRLHVARIVGELEPENAAWGAWAVTCAVLGRPLPPDDRLGTPPPEDLSLAALNECRRRCALLERQFEACSGKNVGEVPLSTALLPGSGEWLAALVALTPTTEPSPLPPVARLAHLLADASAEARRYWEQGACAWVQRAARHQQQARTAHALAPLFPRNAFLGLAGGGAPLWAWSPSADLRLDSHEAALAMLLPRLLRAERSNWAPEDAARVASACARCCARGAGGALAWCVRLEAEAHAPLPRPRAVLLAALQAQPHHKWLCVRGAAHCPAEADALPDILLERQLRLHALPDELRPVAPPTAK